MADRPADMRNATLAGGGCGNSNHFRNAFYINNITGHTSWFPRKPQAEKRRRTKRRTTTHTDPTGTFDNCWHGRFGKLWLTFYIFSSPFSILSQFANGLENLLPVQFVTGMFSVHCLFWRLIALINYLQVFRPKCIEVQHLLIRCPLRNVDFKNQTQEYTSFLTYYGSTNSRKSANLRFTLFVLNGISSGIVWFLR